MGSLEEYQAKALLLDMVYVPFNNYGFHYFAPPSPLFGSKAWALNDRLPWLDADTLEPYNRARRVQRCEVTTRGNTDGQDEGNN